MQNTYQTDFYSGWDLKRDIDLACYPDDENDDDNAYKVLMLHCAEVISTNAEDTFDSSDVDFLRFKIFFHLSEFYWCLFENQQKLFLN